jgi:predicted protein tyrosine phosphatase
MSLQLEPCLDPSEVWRSADGIALLLGSAHHAAAAVMGLIPALDVTHVVCVASSRNARTLTKRLENSGANVVFEKFHMDDMIHEGQVIDIEDFSKELEAIDCAMQYVEKTARPRAVLVHCDMGVNRSPTLVLAYLLRTGLSLREAYRYLFSARDFADPLPGYREALMRYEIKLQGVCTVSKEEAFALHLSELMARCRESKPVQPFIEAIAAAEQADLSVQLSVASSGVASEASQENESITDSKEREISFDHQLQAALTMRKSSIDRLLAEVM